MQQQPASLFNNDVSEIRTRGLRVKGKGKFISFHWGIGNQLTLFPSVNRDQRYLKDSVQTLSGQLTQFREHVKSSTSSDASQLSHLLASCDNLVNFTFGQSFNCPTHLLSHLLLSFHHPINIFVLFVTLQSSSLHNIARGGKSNVIASKAEKLLRASADATAALKSLLHNR